MAVLQNVLSQIGQYRNKTPFQDAFKARQMGAQLGNEQFRLPAVREAIAGGNYQDMRQAYAQYDPSIIKNMTDPDKLSVFEKRLQLLQTPEAREILSQYETVSTEMADAVAADPTTDLTGYVSKLAVLEQKYKDATGSPLPTRMSSGMLRSAKTERTEHEKDLDESYEATKEIVNNLNDTTKDLLKDARSVAPSLEKAYSLINTDTPTATKLNSAMKVYVQALDDSVVMKGEIDQISGAGVLDKARGYINDLVNGVSLSKQQIEDLWGALINVIGAHNKIIDKIMGRINAQTDIYISLYGNRLQDPESVKANVKKLIFTQSSPFKIELGKRILVFKDVIAPSGIDDGGGYSRPPDTPPRPVKKDFKDVRAYELALEQWEIKYGD